MAVRLNNTNTDPEERRAMQAMESFLSLPPEGKDRALDILTGMSVMAKVNRKAEEKAD